MPNSRTHIPAVLFAAAAAHSANAQGVIELDEITAFANLTPTEISRTGATVEILTEDELRAEGTLKLADFLSRRAGVSITANGGIGSTTRVRLRGLPAQYIAVRIDGIDVTDPSGTQVSFDFGRLTTSDISRIEIVKGSQSALYGSSAVGGVINITTNRATEPGTTVSVDVEGGSFETYRGALNVSTLAERGELSFSLSRIQSEGFSAADENAGNVEPDGHDATRLSFFGAYDATDTVRIGASGFVQNSMTQFDNFDFGTGLPVDGPFLTDVEDAKLRGARAFVEIDGNSVDHTLSLSYFENDRFNDLGSGTTNFFGNRHKFDYVGTASLGNASTISFGAEYLEESFRSSDSFGSPPASGTRTIAAIFAEGFFAVSPQTDLSAALRVDDYSDFDNFVSGRLALAYRPSNGTVLRAVASNGFRAPSLFELNDPAFGNPALLAEESVNFELGVDQTFGNGAQVGATLFNTRIDNLIDFVFPAGYVQTTGVTKTQGAELFGRFPIGANASVFGNYTYTDAKNPAGTQLVRVPKHDLTAGVEGNITERLNGVLTVQAVSGLVDGVPLDDYVVANATLRYDLTDQAEAYLRIVNITNEQYQTVRGYGTSDRAFYVGIRGNF